MDLYKNCFTIRDLRDKITSLESQVKILKSYLEVEKNFFKAHCVNEGLQTVKFQDLGTFSMKREEYPTIKDSDLFFDALEELGELDISKKTVDKNTLRAWWNGLEKKPDARDIGLSLFKKIDVSIRKK